MSGRSEDLGTYQMLWDCPYCGNEKLLGLDHRHCPACGAPQDPERRYFPADADKVAVADHRYTGADVVCPSCSKPASNEAEFCGSCGTPLSEAAAARTRKDIVHEAGESVSDSAKAARDEFGGKAPPPAAPPPKKGGPSIALLAVGLLLLVGCAGILTLFFWKTPATVEVTGHQWERTIEVEEYKAVTESDWKEDVPSGATNVSCSKEKKGTKKVEDGEECKVRKKDQGDGTFKEVKECTPKYRSEPTYGEKCSYRIEKWTTAKTEKASGKGKDGVKWPTVRASGKQREGRKDETYTVLLKEKKGGDTHDCAVPLKVWQKLDKGDVVEAKKRMTGGLDCGSVR